MHRRRLFYNDLYAHYPYHTHGVNLCSSYNFVEPYPIVSSSVCVPSHHHHHQYMSSPCYEYIPQPVVSLPPIVHTSVHSDVCYHYDYPCDFYEDDYERPYRYSRSRVQLVDVVPRHTPRTYRVREEVPDKIIIPRSTVIRNHSLPAYERPRPRRIVPLYHSAGPNYLVTSRR